MTQTPLVYRPTARALHWLSALLILATIPAGVTMVQTGISRGLQDTLFIFHKNAGVIIFLLVLARLAFRAANPPPPLPAAVPIWMRQAASFNHWALYGLLLVMAVSGYIRVKAGGFPLEGLDALGVPSLVPRSDALAETAQRIHLITRFPLVVLIVLHVGAALYHALSRRDGVFSRMWPSARV